MLSCFSFLMSGNALVFYCQFLKGFLMEVIPFFTILIHVVVAAGLFGVFYVLVKDNERSIDHKKVLISLPFLLVMVFLINSHAIGMYATNALKFLSPMHLLVVILMDLCGGALGLAYMFFVAQENRQMSLSQ